MLRSVKTTLKCITHDTEVCESIAIVRESTAIVHRDRMAAVVSFLALLYSVILGGLY